jgi:hypothetical protein
MMLFRVGVTTAGVPAEPKSRSIWAQALFGQEPAAPASTSASRPADFDSIDAAWLLQATSGGDMFWRGDRLDQIAFGQRLFARMPASAWSELATVVRTFREHRMLLLTLERMSAVLPATYLAASRAAAALGDLRGGRAFWTMAQAQGALAIVSRATVAGTLDTRTGEAVVQSLFAVPLVDGEYRGGLAAWFAGELLPRLAAVDVTTTASGGELGDVDSATAWSDEGQVLAALAGRPGVDPPSVEWEGQEYRVDLAFAERRRLATVRERQRSYSIDFAMALAAAHRRLRSARSVDDLRSTADQLSSISQAFAAELMRPPPDVLAPGVSPPRPAGAVLNAIVDDLSRARSSDVRGSRGAVQLAEFVDTVTGEVLLSVAYAIDIGDPDSTALLTRNVALRHDFGVGRRDQPFRSRLTWSIPRQDFLPGVPWHVVGSVLGLDVALAPMALRRITADRLADVPTLPSNERHAFAVGVAMLNPRQLTEVDRDRLSTSIAVGASRVRTLVKNPDDLVAMGDLLRLDGWRRRELTWTQAHVAGDDGANLLTLFTLGELAVAGGVTGVNLDAWGTSALQSEGCLCTRFLLPARWRLFSGKPQLGLMAASMPDLNLQVALVLRELGVPVALTRSVLSAAVLEFVEDVNLTDVNDWRSLVRAARATRMERIQDFVAAAAAVDGPLVPVEGER